MTEETVLDANDPPELGPAAESDGVDDRTVVYHEDETEVTEEPSGDPATPASDDGADGAGADPVLRGQIDLHDPAGFPSTPDLGDLCIGQFGVPMLFASNVADAAHVDPLRHSVRPVAVAALDPVTCRGVGKVLDLSPDTEMVGANTKRRVALMEDLESSGDRSVRHLPRNPVYVRLPSPCLPDLDDAVPLIVATRPQPTTRPVTFVDLRPEALFVSRFHGNHYTANHTWNGA